MLARAWTPLAAGVVGLGLVVYASVHPATWVVAPPQWVITPAPLPTMPAPENPAFPPDLAEDGGYSSIWIWVFTVLGVVVALLILIVVIRGIYRGVQAFRAARFDSVPAADSVGTGHSVAGVGLSPAEVSDAVDEALRRLDQAPTPKDAVILAWLAFEDAAWRHGMARDQAQTPTEFTSMLLDRSRVPVADTVRLRSLYLRARFSTIPTTDSDVAQARRGLEHIARTLEEE